MVSPVLHYSAWSHLYYTEQLNCTAWSLCGQSDSSKEQLMSQHLSCQQQVDATASWQAQRNAAALEQAGIWLHRPATPAAAHHHTQGPTPTSRTSLPPAVGFVEVCGIELPCSISGSVGPCQLSGPDHDATATSTSAAAHFPELPYVQTGSVRRNVEGVALALCQGRPVLLEGPPGSGKTALVDELARMTGNMDLVRLHLDDQTDAKSLLGAYVCTAVPGEFVWQPGPLTQVRGACVMG